VAVVLVVGVVVLSAASLLVAQDYLVARGARVVIVSFALGAIPFSNLLAQSVAGTDLRSVGSGTVSGTALYRVAGFAPLAVGGLLDVAKAVPGVLAAGSAPVVGALAAGAAVAGHNWSPFLRGAGGRGVSPAMGALAVVYWPGAVLLLAGLGVGRLMRQTGLVSDWRQYHLPASSVDPLVSAPGGTILNDTVFHTASPAGAHRTVGPAGGAAVSQAHQAARARAPVSQARSISDRPWPTCAQLAGAVTIWDMG